MNARYFPRRLREARLRAGLSQTALAEAVGVVQTVVSGWEHGRRAPKDLDQYVAVAKTLDVTLNDLVGRGRIE